MCGGGSFLQAMATVTWSRVEAGERSEAVSCDTFTFLVA